MYRLPGVIVFITVLFYPICVFSAAPTADINRQSKPQFNATEDACILRKAVEGLGTNDSAIVDVVTKRTNSERQMIRLSYLELFKKDLMVDLRSDLSGKFQNVILALMMPPHEFLTAELYRTLKSKNSKSINQILATRSKSELEPLVENYFKMYHESLLSVIRATYDGDYGLFLVNVVSTPAEMRRDSGIRQPLLNNELNSFPHGENTCGITHNQYFDETLAKESFEQIRQLLNHYEKKHGKPAINCIEEWCTGKIQHAYKTIVEYAEDSLNYYAKELRNAMIGLGTSDNTLIRIIVSRSEIDLDKIAKAYEKLYNTTLESSVKAETSGYYKGTLLRVINPHHYQ